MSAKLMGQVWELKLPHNQQSVLLAYADHADDEGYNARPGIEYVAWKTGYSERQVQRIVRDLERDGLLVETVAAAGRRATTYRVDVSVGVKKPAYVPRHLRSVDTTDCRGDILSGRHLEPVRDDIQMSPEPSRNQNGSDPVADAPGSEPVRPEAGASGRTSRSEGNDGVPTATAKEQQSASERDNDPEYVRLADLLADLIAQNRDGRRPKASDVVKWRRSIRLMVERDDLTSGIDAKRAKRGEPALTADERKATAIKLVEGAIRWSQKDPFWSKNVLSAGKLRERYDQLEAAARAERPGGSEGGTKPPEREFVEGFGNVDAATAERLRKRAA